MGEPHDPIEVRIDLTRVRTNAVAVKRQTGRPLIAVVKSDAYGLGARAVVKALEGVADEFAYFNLDEARAVRKPGLILGPLSGSPAGHAAIGVRPSVGSVAEARLVGRLPVALQVDTGMRWFGCPPDQIDQIRKACVIVEAFTHTMSVSGARMLRRLCEGKVPRLHAAASRLLDQPAAWLDAVRPGLALYRGAVTATTRLAAVRDLDGPAGYRRFRARRAGIILCGYARGFVPGTVLLNGRCRRVLDVGMNTSMIEIGPQDRPGDRVILLGGAMTEDVVAESVGCTPHEVLCRYACLGPRMYAGPA